MYEAGGSEVDRRDGGGRTGGTLTVVGVAVVIAALLGAGAGLGYWWTGSEDPPPVPDPPPEAEVAAVDDGGRAPGVPPVAGEATPALDPSAAVAGELAWTELAPGFEIAELPVLLGGNDVDRILLNRLDPSRYQFQVMSRPAADRDLTEWLDTTGAVLVVNGTYFNERSEPVAPVISNGQPAGPAEYDATHGVFVASAASGVEAASVIDLAGTTWQEAVAGAHDAMVSFPLLVGADGASRTDHVDPDLVASRTFVAQDVGGRIVIGTAVAGFFSLDRLGPFLAAAPLDLVTALNLDGGPYACQAVRLGVADRQFCGQVAISEAGAVPAGPAESSAEYPGLPLVLLALPASG